MPSFRVEPSSHPQLSAKSPMAADLVQEMYLRELKNYKPPQIKPSDAEGHVQKFSIPKPPPSPEEGDIANDLKSYENQTVEVEGQSAEGSSAPEEDWFEDDEDEGVVPPAATH
ncbi:ATP synthase F0 subcomplex subunit H atp14 [Coniosporium apollinis]|uniref:ATP synthase F0 subcomplex subunit H atp14 n=1 Tax=Coniosporium apollinis TaxID=61459 RepID=A0ABQ9P253_9PEZI|nr:ATP synthase F0 subcomplex subunit H atp14 [Coniosporium apollinis]